MTPVGSLFSVVYLWVLFMQLKILSSSNIGKGWFNAWTNRAVLYFFFSTVEGVKTESSRNTSESNVASWKTPFVIVMIKLLRFGIWMAP